MHGRASTVALFALLLSRFSGSGAPAAGGPEELKKFFHEFVGLNDDQIREPRIRCLFLARSI